MNNTASERGRVKLADLAPGERYFGVYSATGRCVYRTRSRNEAEEMVVRNPRLSRTEHIAGERRP